MKKILVTVLTHPLTLIAGALIGAALGIKLKTAVLFIAPIGDIYISLLSMVILPIVLFSIIYYIAYLIRTQKMRLYLPHILTFLVLSMLFISMVGILSGLSCQHFFQFTHQDMSLIGQQISASTHYITTSNSHPDYHASISTVLLKNIIPENIFSDLGEGLTLKIIIIALMMGGALGVLQHPATDKVLAGFDVIFRIFFLLFKWLIVLLPFGLCGLFAKIFNQMQLEFLLPLAKFLICFYITSAIVIVIYTILSAIFLKKGLFFTFSLIKKPLLLAFLSSASLVAIPSAMENFEKAHCNKAITELILPMGVILNEQGKILFFALVTIFIATLIGIHISLFTLIGIVFLAAFLGAPMGARGAVMLPSYSVIAIILGLPLDLTLTIFILTDVFVTPIFKTLAISANCLLVSLLNKEIQNHEI